MNWSDLEAADGTAARTLDHWRRLGLFRQAHPAVGAGAHALIQESPYVFSRVLDTPARSDRVVVGLDLGPGEKRIPVADVFAEGTEVRDAYAGIDATVVEGAVTLDTPYAIVLLEAR